MAKAKRLRSTTVLKDFYQLNDSADPVMLDVKTGAEGQASVTTVKLEDPNSGEVTTIADKVEGSFQEPIIIGTNQDLTDKEMKISTTVKDLSEDTNDTFVDVRITGGSEEFHQRMEKTVSSQGEIVFYRATIDFFKIIS